MKKIFLLIVGSCIISAFGEDRMVSREMPSDIIFNVVSWIEEFLYSQGRMPEHIIELYNKLPQYCGLYESYRERGISFDYTKVSSTAMKIRIRNGIDLYECENNQNIYFFYHNGTLFREYARDQLSLGFIYEKLFLPSGGIREIRDVTGDQFRFQMPNLYDIMNKDGE
jgi:hypothetical protein